MQNACFERAFVSESATETRNQARTRQSFIYHVFRFIPLLCFMCVLGFVPFLLCIWLRFGMHYYACVKKWRELLFLSFFCLFLPSERMRILDCRFCSNFTPSKCFYCPFAVIFSMCLNEYCSVYLCVRCNIDVSVSHQLEVPSRCGCRQNIGMYSRRAYSSCIYQSVCNWMRTKQHSFRGLLNNFTPIIHHRLKIHQQEKIVVTHNIWRIFEKRNEQYLYRSLFFFVRS